MRKVARKLYRGIEQSDMVLYDPEIRQKIIAELERNHELVFIAWKLGGGSLSIGKQGRLQITLYNKDDEFQEFKEKQVFEPGESQELSFGTLLYLVPISLPGF